MPEDNDVHPIASKLNDVLPRRGANGMEDVLHVLRVAVVVVDGHVHGPALHVEELQGREHRLALNRPSQCEMYIFNPTWCVNPNV